MSVYGYTSLCQLTDHTVIVAKIELQDREAKVAPLC